MRRPVKTHKAHNQSSVVVNQPVIFSRSQWKQEILFMLEAVGFEQSGSKETESGTLPVRDPWKSRARVGGWVVRVKDSEVLRLPLMDAKRNISSSCSRL